MSLLLCHRASTFSSLQVYEKLRDKSLVIQPLEKPTGDLETSATTGSDVIESPESVHSNSDSNETQNEAPRIEEETNYDQKDSEKENDIGLLLRAIQEGKKRDLRSVICFSNQMFNSELSVKCFANVLTISELILFMTLYTFTHLEYLLN